MEMPKFTKAEFRKNAQKVVMMASIAAGFTPTPKDDAFVEILSNLINDDEQYGKLCDLLGITD